MFVLQNRPARDRWPVSDETLERILRVSLRPGWESPRRQIDPAACLRRCFATSRAGGRKSLGIDGEGDRPQHALRARPSSPVLVITIRSHNNAVRFRERFACVWLL